MRLNRIEMGREAEEEEKNRRAKEGFDASRPNYTFFYVFINLSTWFSTL
jgi:hypothetical protein